MNKLANYIIRPLRRGYNPAKDLGPVNYTIDHKYYGSRIDFDVVNRRKKVLKCSLFHRQVSPGQTIPLMVYCHGNSGNKTYGYEIVYKMLKMNVAVLTFDFAGCGLSEGKYIFLGYFEQYDIDDTLAYTLENFKFIDPERVGLWGRSMGAVSSLLHASRNESIAVIILDSPFSDFSMLLKEYLKKFKLVNFLLGKYLYKKLRKTVQKKAAFDFENLKPIEEVPKCKAPAFFYHASKDTIVPKHHSKDIFDIYPGEKEYLETKGGHNTKRTDDVYKQMIEFIQKSFAARTKVQVTDRSFEPTAAFKPLVNMSRLQQKLNDPDDEPIDEPEIFDEHHAKQEQDNTESLVKGPELMTSPIKDQLAKEQSVGIDDLNPQKILGQIVTIETAKPGLAAGAEVKNGVFSHNCSALTRSVDFEQQI